jgi:hypothetical protein
VRWKYGMGILMVEAEKVIGVEAFSTCKKKHVIKILKSRRIEVAR